MRLLLLVVLVLAAVPGWAQIQPTPDGISSLPIEWASVGVSPAFARQNTLRLIDPAARATLMAELRASPGQATRVALATMFNSLVSVMGSEIPRRAELAAGLSQAYGELAKEIRATPGMPTEVRVAFGRANLRFLNDFSLVNELHQFGKAQKNIAALSKFGGIAPAAGGQKIDWQIPAPVSSDKLAPGQTITIQTNMKSSLGRLDEALFSYNKQVNRCRLAECGRFSPAFVEKQRQALRTEEKRAAQVARQGVQSVPRLLKADIFNAFVRPESPVRVKQLVANPHKVDLSTEKPIWAVNQKGLELRRGAEGLRLQATFETDIDNPAVLESFKSSIEQFWAGEVPLGGGQSTRLRTSVSFRKLEAGQKFSEGALRLTEGASNCASSSGIQVARVFNYTTPAHEFAHILGLRDGYKTFYDPKARTFIHVQDQRTMMGSHTAPLSQQQFACAVQNLARRPPVNVNAAVNANAVLARGAQAVHAQAVRAQPYRRVSFKR